MKLVGLFIYPIKSCRGTALETAEVTDKGLAWDRELMLVDQQGNFMTQRQFPSLAQVQVDLNPNQLNLFHPQAGKTSLMPTFEGSEITVQVWRDRLLAIDQGEEIAAWFQQVLKLPTSQSVRLVRQAPQSPRGIDPNYTQNQFKPVSFADGFPLLITATASLNDLNQRLIRQYQTDSAAVPMNRFRPNLVIETEIPFCESDWQELSINQVTLALVKPCTRCIITTTDQESGDRHPSQEPLATLSRFRNVPQLGILFGENAIPLQTGSLTLGQSAIAVLTEQ